MQPTRTILLAVVALVTLLSGHGVAQAYVGPGLGAGALGAIFGVIGAVLIAVFAVIYYPIKRVMRRRKLASADRTTPAGDAKHS